MNIFSVILGVIGILIGVYLLADVPRRALRNIERQTGGNDSRTATRIWTPSRNTQRVFGVGFVVLGIVLIAGAF